MEENKNQSKKSKKSRSRNEVTPFDRVLAVYGLQFIQEKFAHQCKIATMKDLKFPIELIRSISSNELLPSTKKQIEIPTSFCMVKSNKDDDNIYPSLKVRLDGKEQTSKLIERFGIEQTTFDNSSVPLDLHRLAALQRANWNLSVLNSDSVAIHRCHRKACFNPEHLYFDSYSTNQSTDYCQVYVLINGVNVLICSHQPHCLFPGSRAHCH